MKDINKLNIEFDELKISRQYEEMLSFLVEHKEVLEGFWDVRAIIDNINIILETEKSV